MQPIQLESEVGPDGMLHLCIPVGVSEARRRVVVRVEPYFGDEQAAAEDDLYGSCADLGLEEPADLPLRDVNFQR